MAGLLAQAYPETATSRAWQCHDAVSQPLQWRDRRGLYPFPLAWTLQSYGGGPSLSRYDEVARGAKFGYYRAMSYQAITIYTDGGCLGNPGPGGWAYVLSADGVFSKESSGSEHDTTNNRMELTAVIEALKAAQELGSVRIDLYTDSQYVKNGITSWIHKWKANGWRTAT